MIHRWSGLSAAGDQNIRRLQIPVHDQSLMGELNRGADIAEQPHAMRERQRRRWINCRVMS